MKLIIPTIIFVSLAVAVYGESKGDNTDSISDAADIIIDFVNIDLDSLSTTAGPLPTAIVPAPLDTSSQLTFTTGLEDYTWLMRVDYGVQKIFFNDKELPNWAADKFAKKIIDALIKQSGTDIICKRK